MVRFCKSGLVRIFSILFSFLLLTSSIPTEASATTLVSLIGLLAETTKNETVVTEAPLFPVPPVSDPEPWYECISYTDLSDVIAGGGGALLYECNNWLDVGIGLGSSDIGGEIDEVVCCVSIDLVDLFERFK